jgi:hypothetical protein
MIINCKEFNIEYNKCPSIIAAATRQFSYNLTTTDTTKDTVPQQFYLVDSSPVELLGSLRGEVIVNRGDLFQTSNIEVSVIVSSNNKVAIQNELFNSSKSHLGINYDLTSTNKRDIGTEV